MKDRCLRRNEDENKVLSNFAHQNNFMSLELKDFVGPTTLLSGHKDSEAIRLAAGLCIAYSDYDGEAPVTVKISEQGEILATRIAVDLMETLRI